MKKKPIIIVLIVFAVILLILFLPIPKGTYDDGGTRDYDALLYKIVVWNIQGVNEDGTLQRYHKTSVFWFPDNQKSYEELWKIEKSRR